MNLTIRHAAAAVLSGAVLLSMSLATLASERYVEPRFAAPSPTAGVPAPYEFYGVTPVPPPMPKDPVVGKLGGSLVGKLGGSLAPGKLAGGPVEKEH